MNQREALRETLEFARSLEMDNASSDNSELDYPHLLSMYNRILEADYAGAPFSEDKIGRWLGWTQACVVMHGATLNDMKTLNKKWADA